RPINLPTQRFIQSNDRLIYRIPHLIYHLPQISAGSHPQAPSIDCHLRSNPNTVAPSPSTFMLLEKEKP
ncbi:hypothetical protein V4V35_23530, partial [Bacillus infantis]|uniref:hypothetical protein n=1 Tax=Bacillus infantis TaxID=324767 RepID=UPI002FBE415C